MQKRRLHAEEVDGMSGKRKLKLLFVCLIVLSLGMWTQSAYGEEVIKVGFFAPLTGFAAADGASAKHAVEIGVKQINDAGGINGKKVKLVVYDDRVDSKEAVAIARKLIEKDKVVAVVSGSYSGPTRVTAPILQKAGIPMVAGYAVHKDITRAGDFIFRNGFLGEVEGAAAAEVAVKNLKAKRIAVLTMDNDFGRALSAGFVKHAEASGVQIVSHQVYSLKEQDYTPFLTKVKEVNPDVIFTSGYYKQAGLICRQSKDLGLKAQILGEEGFDSPKFIEIAGESAEGVIIVTNLNRDDKRPHVQEFLRTYKERYGLDADMVGASSYDAFMIVAQAIREAGTDPKAIRKEIADLRDYDAITGKIRRFNRIGEVTKPVQVQIVRGGKFRYYSVVDDPAIITPPEG
jgi:branched-chain amino acid transport system substrate-binding protein